MDKKFSELVLESLKKIPRGRVTTYALLAKAVRRPGAARAVGNALNKNPDAPKVPCHRVVRSDGSIGGYRYGVEAKMKILRSEGVYIDKGRIKDTKGILFKF